MITTNVFVDRVELHAYGRLTFDECREFEQLSDYRIRFGAPLDLLLDLRELESCSLDALIEQMRYGRTHAHDFGRIAIVSDSPLVAWLALLSLAIMDAEVCVFDDADMAIEWLGAATEMPGEQVVH
ncbi:MAG: spoIIAA-like family protein [Rhodocyclales bacterium]|nr:spoIIAA-like family protein [Rhodocyclales bacterium]